MLLGWGSFPGNVTPGLLATEMAAMNDIAKLQYCHTLEQGLPTGGRDIIERGARSRAVAF